MNALDQWPVWAVFIGVQVLVFAAIMWGMGLPPNAPPPIPPEDDIE